MRLVHAAPLAMLLALGLAPLFILFPALPGGPEHDPNVRLMALWLGAALLGGLAGTLAGAARPMYRTAALILATSLLSIPAMRLALWSGLPVSHGLATRLGLDGESAMNADLYEIWLLAWLTCLCLIVLGWRAVARLPGAGIAATQSRTPGSSRTGSDR
ncbi:hypothetical protein MFUR16E_32040 [Methylobacterium fujisawaense]|uniref:hypothetical protein n=1 Tax=Methylobacterium fujisawaense TaxID=107400 RepID=UPI002F2FFB97